MFCRGGFVARAGPISNTVEYASNFRAMPANPVTNVVTAVTNLVTAAAVMDGARGLAGQDPPRRDARAPGRVTDLFRAAPSGPVLPRSLPKVGIPTFGKRPIGLVAAAARHPARVGLCAGRIGGPQRPAPRRAASRKAAMDHRAQARPDGTGRWGPRTIPPCHGGILGLSCRLLGIPLWMVNRVSWWRAPRCWS